MTKKKRGALEGYVRSANEELLLAEESALAQAALAIADLLESSNLTQRDLAQRIGVSEARISQILCADSNPTVRTLARIGSATGHRMVVEFQPDPVSQDDEAAKPWPCPLRLVKPRWENSNEVSEATVESPVAA